MLAQLAVEAGFDGEAGVEVELVADDGADGAKCVEALGAGPLAIFLLQVAGGDVVGERVAAYHFAPFVVGLEVARAAADDQGQFAFIVDALGDGGQYESRRRAEAATRAA